MTEKVKQGLEGLTLSFKFILPIMGAAYFYAYQGDMHSIKDSISDIKQTQTQDIADVKNSQAQIWKTLNDMKDDTNNKFIQIYQRLK